MTDAIVVPGWQIICYQEGDRYTAAVYTFSDVKFKICKSMHFEKTEQAAIDAAKSWCIDNPPF